MFTFLPLLSIIFFPLLGYRWASRPYDSFFFFLISPFVSHPPYQHVQLTVLLTCIITNLSISFTSFSPHRGRVSVPLFIFHPFASFKYKEHVFFCLSLFFFPLSLCRPVPSLFRCFLSRTISPHKKADMISVPTPIIVDLYTVIQLIYTFRLVC